MATLRRDKLNRIRLERDRLNVHRNTQSYVSGLVTTPTDDPRTITIDGISLNRIERYLLLSLDDNAERLMSFATLQMTQDGYASLLDKHLVTYRRTAFGDGLWWQASTLGQHILNILNVTDKE